MVYRNIMMLLFFIYGNTLYSAVNEVIPGDYEAPRIGMNLVTLYFSEKTMVGPYAQGEKLTSDHVTSRITALKLTSTFNVGGYTVCPMVALPYSVTKSNGDTLSALIGHESSGFADIIVGATGWLMNDKPNNHYLAATWLFFAPKGEYTPQQLLNIGENRYKSTLNIGYVQKLTESFILELSPELALYGTNNNHLGQTLEQRPSYALTSILRYNQTSQLTLFTGFQQNYGGETYLGGIAQNDPSKMEKITLGGYYYTVGGTQILIKYGKELATRDGMKTSDDVLVRFQWWFK